MRWNEQSVRNYVIEEGNFEKDISVTRVRRASRSEVYGETEGSIARVRYDREKMRWNEQSCRNYVT